MKKEQDVETPGSENTGRIINGDYSAALKERVAECVSGFGRFDAIGNPAIPYLSAWHEWQKGMWYEYVSPRFCRLFQCSAAEIAAVFRNSIRERRVYRQSKRRKGVATEIIAHGKMKSARKSLRREGVATGLVEAIYKARLPGGKVMWLKDQAVVESFAADGILLSCGCLTDVTKEMEAEAALKRTEAALQRANQQLQRLAALDGLTRIANRRRLDSRLQQEWRRLGRENGMLALIMCDIDYFKRYNDTYGHQEGDECLKTVARTIERTARRPFDLAARYGGEEFAVLLPHTDLDGALQVAAEIHAAVKALKYPHAGSLVSPFVSLSLGVAAMIPDAAKTPQVLVERADKALYAAKKQGRNRIVG